MVKRPALGKGIGALLGDAPPVAPRERKEHPAEEPASGSGLEIALEAIEPNPNQPRKHFDEEALQELAESIKTLGVIQPITVRQIDNGKFQIISGERRYRAARRAGLEAIPAFIRPADDNKEVLVLALVENIQREDLDALEIAFTYQRMMDEGALTQEEISGRVGKKRSTVANYLRLLQQPAEVQAAIRERQITMGHARAIAGLPEPKDQIKIVRKTVDEALSVRQVEELVQKMAQPKPEKKPVEDHALSGVDSELKEAMKRHFNVRIAIKRSGKGAGSIAIPFASEEELHGLLDKLNNFNA
jgi:ParB family chromosome partitioning protein